MDSPIRGRIGRVWLSGPTQRGGESFFRFDSAETDSASKWFSSLAFKRRRGSGGWKSRACSSLLKSLVQARPPRRFSLQSGDLECLDSRQSRSVEQTGSAKLSRSSSESFQSISSTQALYAGTDPTVPSRMLANRVNSGGPARLLTEGTRRKGGGLPDRFSRRRTLRVSTD